MKDILSKNYSFEEIDTSCSGLETLSQFLCQTFKNYKFTPEYLDWMYNKNPNGGVVGFNAINENELAAHYALIPLQAHYKNQTIRALVSINTATSFKHRGQGLFTILAKKTYLKATNQGFEIILAVANANSIAGFIKKLDFKYIDQLDTCVSPCLPKKIDFKNLKNCLTLPLSPQVFKWRLANPNFNYSQYNNGDTHIVANDLNYFARSIIKISEVDVNCLDEKSLVPKINFWVGISNSYSWDEKPFMKIRIPNFLKPSPLHLIYKNLSNQIALDRTNIHFEAINFDAF